MPSVYVHTCGSICRDGFRPSVETERRHLQKYVCFPLLYHLSMRIHVAASVALGFDHL